MTDLPTHQTLVYTPLSKVRFVSARNTLLLLPGEHAIVDGDVLSGVHTVPTFESR